MEKALRIIINFVKLFITLFTLVTVFSFLLECIEQVFIKHSGLTGIYASFQKLDFMRSIIISLVISLFSVDRYTEYIQAINCTEENQKELLKDLKQILKQMHWKIVYEDNLRMVFKLSPLRSIWIVFGDKIILDINDNRIDLRCKKLYMDKLKSKLKELTFYYNNGTNGI